MEEILIADLSNPLYAEATVQLLNEYAQDEIGGGQELPNFVKENLAEELLKRPAAHVLICFVDRAPAGLLICLEGFSTFACKPLLNIHDLIVSSEYRGRGIAKRLLAKAEKIAINMGCCKLTLEVLEGNTTAKAAYRACGYDGYELSPKMGKALFWQKKLA